MIQPSNSEKQSIYTIIKDLEAHHRRLGNAIDWTKNLAAGVDKARAFGQIDFSVIGNLNSSSVGVLLGIPHNGVVQDVHVTTFLCRSAIDLKSVMPGTESERMAQAMKWDTDLGIKVLETWFVDTIWQGSDAATEVWFTQEMRKWMTYWFPNPPKAVFRSVKTMEIFNIGKRSLT